MTVQTPTIRFFTPSTPEEFNALRSIFREYADSLQVDLCFQGFESELAELPGEYAKPHGALLMALVDGKLAGCCALRPLDEMESQALACASKVAASLTSNLPGPSIFSEATFPSFTSME